jgi:hypothetical protein
MSISPTSIDISHLPDLKRLAQEAKKTGKPYILRENSHDVALLTPVDTERKQQTNRQAIEEILALAGSWKDLDSDDMLEQLDRIRHASKPTPPLALDL